MKRLLSLFISFAILHAQTPFSADSALSYLKMISVTIGARPMGSPNERKAMEFAIEKFREFGLNNAYIMKMSVARSDVNRASINTNSGIAIGILRGNTDRIILIGAHIDSAGPDIPGANDDGSGAASVIELSRVLSKEKHQSTIVFCLFGGEEEGLCGSNFFVQNFPLIDSISLMLQLDMTNGGSYLIPTIDNKSGNAPQWLVNASYEEFKKLGYSDLNYPSHFFTLMSCLPSGGVGSDHVPFLEKNIPAIDFTSDINDPIHTPQDDFGHFRPDGLKRSGDLVYSLVHRFDGGIPAEKTENYFLYQIGDYPLFFPQAMLTAFVIIAVAFSIAVLLIVRRRRIETDKSSRPRVPGLKLFLLAVLIQACIWLSENIVGLIKGVRYPWMAHPEGYIILGFVAALVGISISLKLSHFFNLSKDPYRWFLRTVIFLYIFISLTALISARVALYPSMALLFLSLAMVVRKSWLKIAFWIISPHFMFRLFFSDGFDFISRGMALYAIFPAWMYLMLHLFYILFFALWSFPFLIGFAAIYSGSKEELSWIRFLRTNKALATLAALFIICVIVLSSIPSYSDQWRQRIIIKESIDLNTGEGKTLLESSEYLKNLNVHSANKDTVISGWDRQVLFNKFKSETAPWVRIDRKITTSSDSGTTFDILTKFYFTHRPEKLKVSYSSPKNKFAEVSGTIGYNLTEHNIDIRWRSFPDTLLEIPIHFKVMNSDSVTETIEAKFVEMAEPVRIEKEFANIIPETTFKYSEIIGPTVKK